MRGPSIDELFAHQAPPRALTIVIVPRFGGDANADFYPWLRREIEEKLDANVVIAELLPTKDTPELAPTIENVRRAIKVAPSQTIVVAHSVGCRAALRAAEGLDEELRALVCVAGWFTVDEPFITIVPWVRDAKKRLAPRIGDLRVLLSDDDPFAADYEATRRAFEAIGARVETVAGGKHFMRVEEPDVLRLLLEAASR